MFSIPGKQAVTMTPAATSQIARLMAKGGHSGPPFGPGRSAQDMPGAGHHFKRHRAPGPQAPSGPIRSGSGHPDKKR